MPMPILAKQFPTGPARWRCKRCGSGDVHISLPVWFAEPGIGELQQVQVDFESRPLAWHCQACDEVDSGSPERLDITN